MNIRSFLIVIFAVQCILLAGYPKSFRVMAQTSLQPSIAVILSHKAEPYQKAMKSFINYFNLHKLPAKYKKYNLTNNPDFENEVLHEIGKFSPDLIFALGNRATNISSRLEHNIPIVCGLILNEQVIEQNLFTTGVFLEYPAEIQFQWLKYILPYAKTIGLIYNPKQNSDKVKTALQAADKMGFTLETQEINNPIDLPRALKKMVNRVDVLWGINDHMVLTPQTAKQILLFSFRNRIPFIGPSDKWVEAGALYSLDWDFRDIGTQCAEQAMMILEGQKPESIPPMPPQRVYFSLNLKTARNMKISIPKKVIDEAHKVY